MTRTLVSLFVGLTLLVSGGASAIRPPQHLVGSRHQDGSLTAAPLQGPPVSPASFAPVAMLAPVRWEAIERRVLQGIQQAVASFRFGVADRDELVSIALERAWRAFDSTAEPIRNPEAWGRTIAEHASLDELRRQRRERAHLTMHLDCEDVALSEVVGTSLPGPYDVVEDAERRTRVRERVAAWPPVERRLALLLMDGDAETVTEAARLYRAEDDSTVMYPAKARLLLDALRPELDDLG